MAKDTHYFSHDYNTRMDIKIKKLIAKHGYAGYGIFWAIVEDLYNNENSLPTDFETIAYNLRANIGLVESVVKDFELFVIENENFGSVSIEKRLEARKGKSTKARESANYRWRKDANALRPNNDRNAIKESKVNDSKENESKVKETKEEGETEKIPVMSVVGKEEQVEVMIYPTFDDFWDLYDKKNDRAACEKKWKKIPQAEREKILEHLPAYIASTPDKQYRKNPETYLNNKSWENEITINSDSTKGSNTSYRNIRPAG